MEKDNLPSYSEVAGQPRWRRRRFRHSKTARILFVSFLAFIAYAQWRQIPASDRLHTTRHGLSVSRLEQDLAVCSKLRSKPQDPIGLGRERNARYIDGHKPTLIKNATVWIGEPVEGTPADQARAGKGWEWISADVLVEFGLIKEVAKHISADKLPKDTLVFDAHGRQLTAGVIDMHSHAGVDSQPSLWGNQDTNEMSSDITPYARSKDSIQPGDHQIQVIKSGGVTTSLILPGSGNNIGGEAYVVKLAVGKPDGRNETSAEDMMADPEKNWRYMKMACGENAKRVYGKVGERGPVSRMGESWVFRHAFERAAKYNTEQDDWCNSASADLHGVETYLPQEIEWETLGAALRGQVHINTHCYTIPDLEAMVDHTNEFKFAVRAFHHAHQTYLVPEILKRTWGGRAPASAIFATNMYYKAESYIGSEFAGKYLYEEGLTPVYVSDNPVLNAQHVLLEAAKGYKFGLPYHAALSSVTSEPAELLGLGKRLGKIKPGYDADIVVWDSDPLSAGATPVQVWIDGTAQYEDPFLLEKPVKDAMVPDPKLNVTNENSFDVDNVIFTGITRLMLNGQETVAAQGSTMNVVVSGGKIICAGECQSEIAASEHIDKKHLVNGHITKTYTAFGSTIGLNAIDAEKDTDDGNSAKTFSRAVDGLALDTKKLKAAHDYGSVWAITAPKFGGQGRQGVSVGFTTGAKTALDKGAVWADDAAVHYTLGLDAKQGDATSISGAVGTLRRKLLEALESEDIKDPYSEAAYLKKVVFGKLALVVSVHSADAIAALLRVKASVEKEASTVLRKSSKIKVAVLGGAEAYLVAEELRNADVGVILSPAQSYAQSWDQRRALSGAPLTNGTSIDRLSAAGVLTAIGIEEDWVVRDLGLRAAVAWNNGNGRLSKIDAWDLIATNVYKMLGLERPSEDDFVVYEGDPFEMNSRVVAVANGLGAVTLFG